MATARSAPQRLAGSLRVAAFSATVSTLFGVMLIVWGLSVHSATMTGGGVLAVGRGVMAVLIVTGIRLSGRHTTTFPNGLYKLENLFAAAVGAILLVLAYELVRASIPHLDGTLLFSRDPVYALPFFVAAALLGVVLGWVKRRVGRAEGCPSLLADAYFSFADAVALVIIGVALALDIAGVPRVDAMAGLVVAAFVAVVGAWILRGALRVLLDASVSRDFLDRVRRVAEMDPGVRRVVAVDGRNSGAFVFLHVVVEPSTVDLRVAHREARAMQQRLLTAFPNVDSISVEFGEPAGDVSAAVMLTEDGVQVARDFGSAPSVALVELVVRDETAPRTQVLPNPARGLTRGGEVNLAVFLGRQGTGVLLMPDRLMDVAARETLAAYAIDVIVSPDVQTLPDAIAALRTRVDRRSS